MRAKNDTAVITETRNRIHGTSALIAEHEIAIAGCGPVEPNPLIVNLKALKRLRTSLESSLADAVRKARAK